LENTEQLQLWINHKVETQFGGNLTAFAEKTKVSRQTWMNILNRKYSSLRQQAVADLCRLFDVTEIDLYLIAQSIEKPPGIVKENSPSYEFQDEAARLADYIRNASKEDREFILGAAERSGFKRHTK
jgi:transcriptional regulator with XRE-family HTH domain